MPQFLNQRYNRTVAMIMTVSVMLYVVVNLMSILYLSTLTIHGISIEHFYLCIGLLAVFTIIITLGGMKVISYTDVIQVFSWYWDGGNLYCIEFSAEKSGQTSL